MNPTALRVLVGIAALGLSSTAPAALAQSGGDYDLTWSSIDGGAGTSASGNGYELVGTVGQADVGELSGNGYALDGGFWSAPGAASCVSFADCADLDNNGIRDNNCVWWSCSAGTCAGTDIVFADMGGQFGVCVPDGAADGNDRFHALNCFSNSAAGGSGPYPCEDSPPMAYNVDAGGSFGDCNPDGVCDGNDAFHALNAFQGSTTCSCPSGPAPAAPQPPVVVAAAGLRLQADRRTLQPGETVEVDAFLAGPLADLRGYQLHVSVRNEKDGDADLTRVHRTGALQLIDIAVQDRKDAAFAGLTNWRAFNLQTGQMLAGLDTRGVPASAGAYLATFTFRSSPDASGDFRVELLHDQSNPQQRTFLFPTPAGAKIAIESVTPAVVTVVTVEQWRPRGGR